MVQTLMQHVKIESRGRRATGIPPLICLLEHMNVLHSGGTQAVTTEVTAALTTIIRQESQLVRCGRSQRNGRGVMRLSEEMGATIVQSGKE